MNKLQLVIISLLLVTTTSTFAEHHMEKQSDVMGIEQQIDKDLLIENARVKATIPGVKVSAGYFKLTNNSDETMTFTSANTSAATFTEYHTMAMDNNKMVMRKMDFLEIPAHQSVLFKPKGMHLMFMGLTQRFTPGESIEVTLTTDNGETYNVTLPVMDMASH
jgi:copper(I)-binding protein